MSISHNNKTIFFGFKASFNFATIEHVKITKNKYTTYKLLEKGGIPIPKHSLYKNYKNCDIDYHLVCKPLSGTRGDHVFVNILNKKELDSVIMIIKIHNN